MKTYSISEWGYLPLRSEAKPDGVSEADAAGLYKVAQSQQALLGLRGSRILEFHHNGLRAQQVVGVLVTDNCRLEILPKIDDEGGQIARRSLVQMLMRVIQLRISSSGATKLDLQEDDILEILIRYFAQQLFQAVHRGLSRNYNLIEADLPSLRGQLNVTRQLTKFAATPNLLSCRFDEFSSDTPLNQILKAAVLHLARITRSAANKRMLLELRYPFEEVTDISSSDPLPGKRVRIDRTNASYRELFELALMFLSSRSQTVYSGIGQGYSLLFEMNTLFEEFVARSLQRLGARLDVIVTPQGPKSHVLRDQTGQRVFQTIPDMHLVSKRSNSCLIVDTKWKRLDGSADGATLGVSSSDIYQMMAYAEVYDAKTVLLLYPHSASASAQPGLLKRFRTTTSDKEIIVGTLSLSHIGSVDCQLTSLLESIEWTA